MNLKTDYEVGAIPFPEHPCPQRERKNWLNLNGEWDFCKILADGQNKDYGKILVPFSPETINSNVAEGFTLLPNETLVYTRVVALEKEQLTGKIKLHFGAVDSDAKVLINGNEVGSHCGGFTPFCFDVSAFLRQGDNVLQVKVRDEATRNGNVRGKQSDKRGGIWYTPQSGIWQTVWLEFMPSKSIENLRITPYASQKQVVISFDYDGEVELTVYDDGKEIITQKAVGQAILNYEFTLWSPENPKLYDFIIKSDSGDEIKSYFGVRSYSIVSDENGKKRFGLNGKPYFYNGVLDQGYWSDGMLTYPSDKAVIDELTMLKEMGFNTVRKHIKLEPMRWYYHCDRLGLAVWQDFVNGGGEYKFSHVALLPFLGFHHRDDDYKYFARECEQAREQFIASADETVDALYNVVSLAVWVVFNEGWGQFDSAKVTERLVKKDPTRIIDSVSGWHDQGANKTTVKSMHTYYTPLKVPKDTRAVVLSEFGGYSMKTSGHVYDENKEFGYKKFHDKQSLTNAVEKLYLKKLLPLIKKGLSGAIYTQVSDVEEEINGLVTYDRKVQKIDTADMRKINDTLKQEWQKIK